MESQSNTSKKPTPNTKPVRHGKVTALSKINNKFKDKDAKGAANTNLQDKFHDIAKRVSAQHSAQNSARQSPLKSAPSGAGDDFDINLGPSADMSTFKIPAQNQELIVE